MQRNRTADSEVLPAKGCRFCLYSSSITVSSVPATQSVSQSVRHNTANKAPQLDTWHFACERAARLGAEKCLHLGGDGCCVGGCHACSSAMASARSQVAESTFSFLHMELVQMALGSPPGSGANLSTSQLQHASRKIESIGFQVGVRLVERYTRERPRFTDTLEIIKFICKDFWMEVYRKQIDKLQTNNRVSAARAERVTWHDGSGRGGTMRSHGTLPLSLRLHASISLACMCACACVCVRVRLRGSRVGRASTCCKTTRIRCSRAARPLRPGRRPPSRWRRCTSNFRAASYAAHSLDSASSPPCRPK